MFNYFPPPSKSYINRALIIASLAEGTSKINNFKLCSDTKYLLKGLKKFGVTYELKENSIEIIGKKGFFNTEKARIYCGNAGTTLRFLFGLSALNNGKIILTGSKRMSNRPVKKLINAYKQLGAKVILNDSDYLSLEIYGHDIIKNKVFIKNPESSQFISSLIMVAPYFKNGLELFIDGSYDSKQYVDLTIQLMSNFGMDVERDNYNYFRVLPSSGYKSAVIKAEHDYSSASYFLTASAITGQEIKIMDYYSESSQPDKIYPDILKSMGCSVRKKNKDLILSGKVNKSVNIEMNETPDLVPSLLVASLFANGTSKICNIDNLKHKESNRINSLIHNATKLGAKVFYKEKCLFISPSDYKGISVNSFNDHRIAMAFAVASLNIKNIVIRNRNCVKKSYPDFWFDLEKFREKLKK